MTYIKFITFLRKQYFVNHAYIANLAKNCFMFQKKTTKKIQQSGAEFCVLLIQKYAEGRQSRVSLIR